MAIRTQLHAAAEMTASEISTFERGDVAVFSRPRPDPGSINEDAAATIELSADHLVLAVADGVGGHPAGAEAARGALEQLIASLRPLAASSSARDAILDGFEAAQRHVNALGVGAATTLVAVEIHEQTARSYHVGDSTALIVGNRGKVKMMTVAHSPVGYAVEAGFLDEDEALNHAERHVISNAIGSADMKIEIGPVVPLSARDTVLIASDGLFDNLRLEEIIETVRKGPLDRAATQLAEDCRARMDGADEGAPAKADDLTFVILRPRSKSALCASRG